MSPQLAPSRGWSAIPPLSGGKQASAKRVKDDALGPKPVISSSIDRHSPLGDHAAVGGPRGATMDHGGWLRRLGAPGLTSRRRRSYALSGASHDHGGAGSGTSHSA